MLEWRDPGTPASITEARVPATVLLLGALGALAVAGCNGEEAVEADPMEEEGVQEVGVEEDGAHERFLDNLAAHCGEAFPGGLEVEPEGDEMLEGDELLIAHFRDCEEDEVRIPFHIEEEPGEWDSSRTWYVMRGNGVLELRHDHRLEDGSEDDRTWYGGFSMGPGTHTRHDFLSPERTEEADGVPVGWRIEIEPGEVYRYGTTQDGEYTWMVEFDLSEPYDGGVPDAWGHDEPPTREPGPP